MGTTAVWADDERLPAISLAISQKVTRDTEEGRHTGAQKKQKKNITADE